MHLRQDQITEELRQDLQFDGSCWTCTPSDPLADDQIPLTIDGFPVVIPVRHHYPLVPLSSPPPDPHFKAISPTSGVSDQLVAEIFGVFTEALGFYILINGYLQVIVPDNFDYEAGLARLPTEFGRLKVSLTPQSIYPTADHEALAPAPSVTLGLDPPAQTHAVTATRPAPTPAPAAAALSIALPTRPQRPLTFAFKETHGSTIHPAVKNGKPLKDRFEGKIGVLLAPNGDGPASQKLLTVSTHVLSSFAVAAKTPLPKESEDWITTIRLTSVGSREDVSLHRYFSLHGST
jgi:hypothetical protein